MRIIKVINNNTVLVTDDNDREQIVSGRGIGFGRRYGDSLDPALVQKTYMVTGSELQKKLITLLSEIPSEYIRFTDDMVRYIRAHLSASLSDTLLITLTDHISFAIERQRQGIQLTNPLIDSIADCYPAELELGKHCIVEAERQLGVRFHPDEAGFIAMHIVNAEMGTQISDVYDITRLTGGCVEIAEYYYGRNFDREDAHFARFMTHLKYLAQRLYKNEEISEVLSKDSDFVDIIKKSCKKHYKCAQCIQEYILKTCNKTIGEDELLTLTIHLKRICA
ncbi:MAG: PRD domain-containing protein [Clostridia bacterium]|nr:PRD domain-containing protein [Clostridia bacterium]